MNSMSGGGTAVQYLIEESKKLKEEIEILKQANTFSFDEVQIGTWIDGKPLYRKMIDFGVLPNNDYKFVNPSIQNIKSAHVNIGECYWTLLTQYNIIYSLIHEQIITVTYNKTQGISIRTNGDLSNYSAYICLEYTKTTD